ncbi:hypothetical protein BDN72DRAFT_861016 [Pluteus cervinus]|uniref:Uncharacterized protein n=1 Tax=Pluteus cervinus TaxID=181527 RepID=A0ACD3AGQ8_9AGAR|nr:hypothetical protein BDN72DRAFT_861016 [Pluteus cervinus]
MAGNGSTQRKERLPSQKKEKAPAKPKAAGKAKPAAKKDKPEGRQYNVRIEENREAIEQRNEVMEKLMSLAFKGYGQIDLVKWTKEVLRFGAWNFRDLKPLEVQKLVNNFGKGIKWSRIQNSLPCILKDAELPTREVAPGVPFQLTQDMHAGDDLPLLLPSDFAVSPLYGASGQHRWAAIEVMRKKLQAELDETVEGLKRLRLLADQPAVREQIAEEEAKMKTQTTAVSKVGRWMVRIYDYKILGEQGARYLSQNDTETSYKAQEEEALVTLLQTLHDSKTLSIEEVEAETSKVVPATSKMNRIISQEGMKTMLVSMLDFGCVYFKGPMFTQVHLVEMVDIYGGLLAHMWLRDMEILLRIASSDPPFATADAINDVIYQYAQLDSHDPAFATAEAQLKSWRAKLLMLTPCSATLWIPMMSDLDDLVDTHFLKRNVLLGIRSDSSMLAMEKYMGGLEDMVSKHATAFPHTPADILARMYLVLSPVAVEQKPYSIPRPLSCPASWRGNETALKSFCRWFDCQADYRHEGRKARTTDDATSMILLVLIEAAEKQYLKNPESAAMKIYDLLADELGGALRTLSDLFATPYFSEFAVQQTPKREWLSNTAEGQAFESLCSVISKGKNEVTLIPMDVLGNNYLKLSVVAWPHHKGIKDPQVMRLATQFVHAASLAKEYRPQLYVADVHRLRKSATDILRSPNHMPITRVARLPGAPRPGWSWPDGCDIPQNPILPDDQSLQQAARARVLRRLSEEDKVAMQSWVREVELMCGRSGKATLDYGRTKKDNNEDVTVTQEVDAAIDTLVAARCRLLARIRWRKAHEDMGDIPAFDPLSIDDYELDRAIVHVPPPPPRKANKVQSLADGSWSHLMASLQAAPAKSSPLKRDLPVTVVAPRKKPHDPIPVEDSDKDMESTHEEHTPKKSRSTPSRHSGSAVLTKAPKMVPHHNSTRQPTSNIRSNIPSDDPNDADAVPSDPDAPGSDDPPPRSSNSPSPSMQIDPDDPPTRQPARRPVFASQPRDESLHYAPATPTSERTVGFLLPMVSNISSASGSDESSTKRHKAADSASTQRATSQAPTNKPFKEILSA